MRKSKNSCLLAGFFLLILFIHFCDVAYAGGGSLLASLRQDRELLDRITKTSVSLNKVSLLHLGKRSVPVRLSLIQQAKKFLFVSVPYWFADQSGEMMYSAIASQKRRNPSLDVRVFEDWSSPGSTGDPFALNMFFRIERLTEGNAFLWNSPYWGRNFSLKLIQNQIGRAHV